MDAYTQTVGRRILPAEIIDWVAREVRGALVYGFAEVIDRGDAVAGGERVAGFMETHDRREWLVPLTAARGFCWKTPPVPPTELPNVCFAFSVGFGNGSPLPQPTGRWDWYVNDRLAASVRVAKHSQLWRQGPARFAFAASRIESAAPYGSLTLSSVIREESFAAFGPALLCVPTEWVTPGQAAVVRVVPVAESASRQWLQVATAPGIVDQADLYRAVDLLTPRRVPSVDGLNVYFGDIHTHSGQVLDDADGNRGCGAGSRLSNYRYAAGPGGVDFYALTDHEWQIDPARSGEYLALADAHNRDGEFVCLPGFEFTSLLYGHRDIYFRGSGGTVVNASRGWGRPTKDPAQALPPAELWPELERTGVPFLSVPHHPSSASHPFNWNTFEPRYDRLVEVYSCWGSSEYYGDFPRGVTDRYRTLDVRDALGRGFRVGLIGSSDGHDGHPGNAQSPLFKHHHLFHPCGSGWAAVLAPELTRAAVFDALMARRCYATTGVPIVLSVQVDGQPMGSELPARRGRRRPCLRVSCDGANGLEQLRIVRNDRVVHTEFLHGQWHGELEWEDAQYRAGESASYYVRVVQVDRESAWSSPVWV